MPKLSKLTVSKSLAFISSVLAISLSLAYFASAWTEPTAAPPIGNVSTPLNIGSTGQSKVGGLILNTGGAPTGLTVQSGAVNLPANSIDSSEVSFNYADSSSKGGAATTANSVPWSGVSSKPSYNCGAANQGLKSIDLNSGAVSCETDDIGGGGVTGSGTANYISKWTGGTSLGNSVISDDGNKVYIGTSSISGKLNVYDSSGYAISGQTSSAGGVGVYGSNGGSGNGIFGSSSTGNGVYGTTAGNGASGVYGQSLGGSNGAAGTSGWGNGVYAASNSGNGVYATSNTGYGVYGQTNGDSAVYGNNLAGGNGVAGTSVTGNAVYARSSSGVGVSSFGGTFGVYGVAPSTGIGVYGSCSSGNGVYGYSGSSWGVSGYSSSSSGVEGRTGSGWAAVYGKGPTYGVFCDGTACGGTRAWTVSSDERLKTNITTIENALDKVEKLRGVNFEWKNNNKTDIGFIAQEVKDVVPEIVSEDGLNGYYTMETSQITAVLVEAMKEQQKQIEAQQKEISQLKEEINALKSTK